MHREIADHEDVRMTSKENDRTHLLERRHHVKQDRRDSTIS